MDWYVATTWQLQTATYEFTHFRKLAELSDQSQYAIDLVEDQFPCLYWVSDIVDEATNEPCFVYEQRKYKVEGDVDSPRIHENEEAMFTAYQSTEVQFLGPHDLQSIKVSGTYMPQIKEIQDWVLRCGQAPVGLDVLVRGATPVTLQFSAVLSTPIGSDIDFTLLQGKVADYINAIPFDGVLAVSGLVALLHSSLPAGSFVSEPALFASLWLSPTPTVFGVTDRLVLDQFLFGTNRTSILYCGASKWNPIEHRLFAMISKNWAGYPLRSLATMLARIRGTTTETGLSVTARWNRRRYPTKEKVTKEEKKALRIRKHKIIAQWNYTITPRKNRRNN